MKKILSILLICSLLLGVMITGQAAEFGEMIDGSILIREKESFSDTTKTLRGAYYQSGSSYIGEAGSGKITASGTTNAHRACDLEVSVMVERLVNGNWVRYTSWSASKSGTTITSTKTLTVPRGYYYRVACYHKAGPDSSGSYTNGIYIA